MNVRLPVDGTRGFRDLRAWQEAMNAAEMVYKCTASWPENERFGLISQARRAAVSVPANIAEGHGRGGSNEFRHFLAAGSMSEVQTHIELALRFGYMSELEHKRLEDQCIRVAQLIGGFVRSLDRERENGQS